jgi:hypothetical protein
MSATSLKMGLAVVTVVTSVSALGIVFVEVVVKNSVLVTVTGCRLSPYPK